MKKALFILVSTLLALSCRADILVYNYSVVTKLISDGHQGTVSQTGQMFLDLQTTNSVTVVVNKKAKQYSTLSVNQTAVSIAGNGQSMFLALITLPAGLPKSGVFLGSPIIGQIQSLQTSTNNSVKFPGALKRQSTWVSYGDADGMNTYNSISETYGFSPSATLSANNAGLSLNDAVAAYTSSLANQGYTDAGSFGTFGLVQTINLTPP